MVVRYISVWQTFFGKYKASGGPEFLAFVKIANVHSSCCLLCRPVITSAGNANEILFYRACINALKQAGMRKPLEMKIRTIFCKSILRVNNGLHNTCALKNTINCVADQLFLSKISSMLLATFISFLFNFLIIAKIAKWTSLLSLIL